MIRAALAVAIVAVLGTAAAASLHASPAVLGWCAALAFVAIAVAAGATARDLHAPDDVHEPREPRGPSQALLDPQPVTRRSSLGALWLGALGALGALGIIPLVALARRPERRGTAWTPGARLVTTDGKPIKAADIAVGGVETVFPQGQAGASESATVLIRLEENVLRVRPERAGWAPGGNVAYSKICTHAGCPVAIYRHASYQLYCPCHQSVFDVLDEARPIAGPATRALPQLALDIDREGYLIARGDYTEPVGPDTWWRTI